MPTLIQTPDDRFENLPDFPFDPHYLEIEKGLRMHYVEEGSADQLPVLMLHGEPSWSYLYRKMIPGIRDAGYRAIAPDLIGFGKSDKWKEQEAYSYQKHLDWLKAFILKMDLKNIVLFCQDWGGLLGLRIVAEMPERFSRIVASNTFLPTGMVEMPESFMKWQAFSQKSPDFDIGKVIDMATISELSPEVIAAYQAPFPSEDYKAGARIFPMLVPVSKDDPEAINNQAAWKTLMKWEKPFLTIFADSDPIMAGAEKVIQQLIPGAKGQAHSIVHAGHFIQEDQGEELARQVVAFIQAT